jgi:hypothetical protein
VKSIANQTEIQIKIRRKKHRQRRENEAEESSDEESEEGLRVAKQFVTQTLTQMPNGFVREVSPRKKQRSSSPKKGSPKKSKRKKKTDQDYVDPNDRSADVFKTKRPPPLASAADLLDSSTDSTMPEKDFSSKIKTGNNKKRKHHPVVVDLMDTSSDEGKENPPNITSIQEVGFCKYEGVSISSSLSENLLSSVTENPFVEPNEEELLLGSVSKNPFVELQEDEPSSPNLLEDFDEPSSPNLLEV